MTKHKAHSGGDPVSQGQPSKASQREATGRRASQQEPEPAPAQPGQAPNQRSIQGKSGGDGDGENHPSADAKDRNPGGRSKESSPSDGQQGGSGAGGAGRHDRSERSDASDRADAKASKR